MSGHSGASVRFYNLAFLAEVSCVPLQRALRHLQTAFRDVNAARNEAEEDVKVSDPRASHLVGGSLPITCQLCSGGSWWFR